MAKKLRKVDWEGKADTEWSRVIREVGECEMSGLKGVRGEKKGWKNLKAHHIIERGLKEYRHDLSNGICLGQHCHKWDEDLSPHQNKKAFFEWLAVNRPGQYAWYLRNTVEEKKVIGNTTIIVRKPIRRKREETYRQSYERLKEIKKLGV